MINELKNIELEYIRCFSKEKNYASHIEFFDNRFRNTYMSNVTVLNEVLESNKLVSLIENEVKLYQENGRQFLNFEINEELNKNIIKCFSLKPERIDSFDYLLIESNKYVEMHGKEDTELRRVDTKEDYKNLININVKDNEKILGRSYAIKRIKRKVQVYKDDKNDLQAYICYYQNEPIGSCEILIKNKICKIEDFGILKEYRGKGFGTHIIRNILESNHQNGINYTYLIAEKNGEAERLYKKLGFKKYGEKTQLIWC